MKKVYISFLALFTSILLVQSCNTKSSVKTEASVAESTVSDNIEIGYDSVKAQKLGADEYGMKKYVLAFLKKGANTDLPKEEADNIQIKHLKNIERMAEEGKLVLAGPFFGKDDLRGIYVFNVETIEEAEALTNSDPAIQQGVLEMELKEWYGTAALMEVNELHKTLEKKSVSDG